MGEGKRRHVLLAGLALAVLATLAEAPAGASVAAGPGSTETSARYERKPAVYSAAERLDRVMTVIETAEPWATVAGPAITEYHADRRRGVVRVGVERVTPDLRRTARRTFGDAVVLHQADRYHRTARAEDDAPRAAGAVISTDLGRCTSGFGVSRHGSTYFLGAGHCFRRPGEIVTNHGGTYGTVAKRRFAERGPDAALVASAFGPRMYVGGSGSERTRAVKGARTPRAGATVCTSGAATGETCAAVRRQSDICVRFGDGVTTCHLTRAVSTDGSPLVEPGDSGGPVYTGRTYAVGMAVGGNEDGTELLYHPVGYLLDLWHARLLTNRGRSPRP